MQEAQDNLPFQLSIKHAFISSIVFGFAMQSIVTNEAYAEEIVSNVSNQKSIAITIYNNNLALVKDKRQVKLSKGLNQLALRDVSAQIRPETALLKSTNHAGSLSTLEQNFDYDLLTPQKLLEKYVGKQVTVIKTNPKTGAEISEKATILSANNGVIVKIGNRIETGINGRIVYDNVPDNLRDRPTLVTQLNSTKAANHTVELSYLTGGLGWKADYVAALNVAENAIDLSGWVTLNNTSGTSYNNAKLQLVAGDVNQVRPTVQRRNKNIRMETMAMADASAPMAEESLLEYHLYTLGKTTNIKNQQTKQVALLSANNIPATKQLVFKGQNYYYRNQSGNLGQKMKAGVFVEFDNKVAHNLGMPLPKGVLRMYKNDSQGNAQFVGEDHIDHTPKNETVRLKLGEAFDVTASKMQTDYKVVSKHHIYESAYKIVLKNAKSKKVTVTVQEPIPADWEILSESHKGTKTNSHLNTWKVTIPAESSTTLTYKTRVKY